MGVEAFAFVDFCARAGLAWWQILPLGPTAYGDSPYQSPSAFAGNPYLIDPRSLMRQGLLSRKETEHYRTAHKVANSDSIDYGLLFERNPLLLQYAWRTFSQNRPQHAHIDEEFFEFCATQGEWLDDYALFTAIKESQNFKAWSEWPAVLQFREKEALRAFTQEHSDDIWRIKFTQYLFFSQWQTLKEYAHSKGIHIIGDIPIFAAYDSADVWAHPELFELDAQRKPIRVAGVPPDYFTVTGQLWGNPLYEWSAHAQQQYTWWIERVQHALRLVDALRIDHFRGFEAYWAVPADASTAEGGHWEKGPGHALFRALEAKLGNLPIIAEDLGFITPEVIELRDSLGFPGMKILQFAFESDKDSPDYPHNYPSRCVAYTGTHDNDTATGWYSHAPREARTRARRYLNAKPNTFAMDLIREVWSSPAQLAIAPMQDFLGLGSEARMNFPGTTGGWWRWRMSKNSLTITRARRIQKLSKTFFRIP